MNDLMKSVDPIQLEYRLFFIFGLNHQIHVVGTFSGDLRYSISMGTAFNSSDGARACFREVLFDFDSAGKPSLVDDWYQLGYWPP